MTIRMLGQTYGHLLFPCGKIPSVSSWILTKDVAEFFGARGEGGGEGEGGRSMVC